MSSLKRVLLIVLIAMTGAPFALLTALSLGSGWSYPNLLPDRLDLSPWQRFLAGQDGIGNSLATSLTMSLCVSVLSTGLGLVSGRALRRRRGSFWMFIAYLPFVLSPVIVAICLYDLEVRLRIASTFLGVLLAQFLFAFAFASVFFCEMWNARIERAEQLVATLGGRTWDVWRHAILPQTKGLIFVCWIQTALFSWTDFGLVSVLGGGNVPSLTLMLFAYIREASVNQAAQASLMLLAPPVFGYLVMGAILLWPRERRSPLP